MKIEPKKPYVYQPFGSLSHPEKGDRLFGVSGINAVIRGLTKHEAEAVCELLISIMDKEVTK